MSRSLQGPRPYDRQQAMSWLATRHSWAGVAGAHHYSLPCHREHFRILKAEQAALSGTESLPTIPRSAARRAA